MKVFFAIFLNIFCFGAIAETGILFISHGTMSSSSCDLDDPSQWENHVLKTLSDLENKLPHQYAAAFGMWNSRCFDKAIHALETKLNESGKELDHLVVFPLFISSHSLVIEMQKFIFKKRQDRAIPLPKVRPTYFEGKITYMNAFDYSPHLSMILANRFHHLVHMAKDQGYAKTEMELILIMHGPVKDEDNLRWTAMGAKYNSDISYLFPVKSAHVISLRDDAAPEVRREMTEKLRSIVSNASNKNRIALALPLLISNGGIDRGILKRLEGLDFVWSGQALFPDEKLKDVILNKLDQARIK